jgi:hypothetical protein
MASKAVSFRARVYGSVGEALSRARGGEVVTVDRLPGAYVTTPHERRRLHAAGVGLATWHVHEGVVVSVPVN